jgi:hypothetical protein
MGLFDNISSSELEQMGGLFAAMPTFSGRRNPMQPMAGYWGQAGEREKAEEERKRQIQRQQMADRVAAEKRQALQNVAGTYNQQGQLFSPPGLLAGATPGEVGQFRQQQGILAGMAPSAFAQEKPKVPTSVQEYEYAQQTPGYQDFLKSKQKTIMTKEDQPLSLEDLARLQATGGGQLPLGTTMRQAGQLGATLKKKPIAAESAGKQAMIDTATAQTSIVEDLIFPKGIEGKINEDVIKGMTIKTQTPGILQPLTAGVSVEGQKAAAAMETGIQAITRLETGAAMAPTEIDNTRKRFQPMWWDADDVKRQKFKAYKLFMKNSKKYFDPNILQSQGQSAAIQNAINKAFNDATKTTKARPPLSSFER